MTPNFPSTDPRLVPSTANRLLPSGGKVPVLTVPTTPPGAPGSSGGFASLVTGNGGFPNPTQAPIQARQTSPENPAFDPTPSTFQPGTGSNVVQNGSGLYGGQNLPPINTANATTQQQRPVRPQPFGIGRTKQ